MTPALEIKELSKTFSGKKGSRVEALKKLSLTVAAGEVFGFLGPNGAGKSTTIKILMGLIKPTSGEVFVAGNPAGSLSARKKAGYLPENPSLYDYLTADEYLLFVGRTFGMSGSQIFDAADRILKLVDLHTARKRPIRTFSKGMTQRLALAQALIHDPEVCILDEPMSGLDPLGRALVKEIIVDLKKQGKCVFFSTHITADVEQVCDRVGILVTGSLRSVESLSTVFSEGIEGYQVLYEASSGNGESFFPKDAIAAGIQEITDRGGRISLIEPRRKDLEAFFLDIVKTKSE